MKTQITLFLTILLAVTISQAQVVVTSTDYFDTRDQMLLANEMFESGEPFAEELGYDLDLLDPMDLNSPDSISYTLGIENYEYSRYLLGTVISRSGLGLHMMWAPMIAQMAAMEPDDFDGSFTGGTPNGFKEDDELMKNIMHFGMLANQMAPANPWPQFADFEGGDPHLPQAVADDFQMDFSTLRWDRDLMDKTLSPGAMGQSLVKQYFWAQDMLGAFHDSDDNGIDPDGTVSPDSVGSPNFDPFNNVYYGGNNLDGFIGQILTAESINKTMFLINSLAYDGTEFVSIDPATYDPVNGIKYFPHRIGVTETIVGPMMPPKADVLTIVDASSDLFDQLSYLYGTLNYKNMMDPENNSDEAHLAYHTVFDGNPFPAPMSQTGMPGPFDLMKGTSKVIFMNLMAMHFDMVNGTFINTSGLSGGIPTPGDEISTFEAGYLIMVLAKMTEEFASTPLEQMALDALNAQSSFVMNSLRDATGGYYNGYTLNQGPITSVKTSVAQAAAARGLYAAYSLTGNEDYLVAANNAYDYLIANYYVPQMMAFKTELNNDIATYTPLNFAVVTGALREAALVGGYSEAAAIYTRFFKKVANSMQLAEFDASGETGNDSDGDGIPFLTEQPDQLAPVFATEAELNMVISGIDNSIALNDNDVVIYPNPASGNTTISVNLEKEATVVIDVISITGKVVQTVLNLQLPVGQSNTSMNVDKLSAGIYYIRINVGSSSSITKKLIVF
ncbi:MAG: T9SS type A sorting domain-containing protein [Bacteroidota bacterium]